MKKLVRQHLEDFFAFIIQMLLGLSIVVIMCLSIFLPVYAINLGLRILGLHQNLIYAIFMIAIFIIAIKEARKEVNK